jgi:hypothetical protein
MLRMTARLHAHTHPHGAGLTDAAHVVACGCAVLFIASGVLHVSAAADHTNLPVMMVGFLVVACLQAGFGALLLWRRPDRLLLGGGLFLMSSAVGIWLLSRTAGLPLLPGGHMEPIGFKDAVTVLLELASVPALLLLRSTELPQIRLPSPRLGTQAVAGLAAGTFLLFVPALVLGGGEHHSAAQLAHEHGQDQMADADRAHGHGGRAERAGGGEHAHAGAAPAGSAKTARKQAHSHNRASRQLAAADTGGGHDHGAGEGSVPADGDRPSGDHGTRGGGGHQHGGGGRRQADGGGGHHGGGQTGAGGDQHAGGEPSDHQHGGPPPPKTAQGAGVPGPDDPGGLWWGAYRLDYEPHRAAQNGDPGSGYAFVFKGPPDPSQGRHPHSDSACKPTGAQASAAQRLYRDTDNELRKYANNPGRAIADGFAWAFGPTDRIIHMINVERVFDPTVGDPKEIESFLYVPTDRGLVPVGGMYIMPEAGKAGPAIGGCVTQWHEHGEFVARWASLGTMERTPEMLHVWTYPGLEPFGHYDGRTLSQLWRPTRFVPMFCREFGDASDACL